VIPLLLFLLGCVEVYLGTLDVALDALMPLSARLRTERSGRSRALTKYLDDPALLFVPLRLLSGLALVLATILVVMLLGGVTIATFGGVLLAVAAYTVICLHLLPAVIVRQDPERVLEVLLPPFAVVAGALEPLSRLASGSQDPRRAAAGLGPPAEEQSEAAESYLEVGEQTGLIEQDERRLLRSIFAFGDTLVREVMTPRPDIAAIRADATLAELAGVFREEGYSRLPVYSDSLDNIVGIVFVKDLILLEGQAGETRPVTSLMRPAYFVPETKRVAELLGEFQKRRLQVAIVVDEYGGTAGLVTLEDLLEEIVGEIRDEYDLEAEPIVDEGNGSFVFNGKVGIIEMAERLGVDIERQGFETVGGYLLSHVGRVPAKGETFDIEDVSVEVLDAERRRINKVRIRRRQPVAEPVRELPRG
jgi:CBS domain containing-hemolysin-like protein